MPIIFAPEVLFLIDRLIFLTAVIISYIEAVITAGKKAVTPFDAKKHDSLSRSLHFEFIMS